ncbi:hypothetical protein GJ496_000868 [Pomphorhynchus laevis]|nr:hypothetical protein GJ496_000868 [Pomphorhynchus laevis]
MSASDCRERRNLTRVRIFSNSDLCKESLGQRWDRIKIVCSQPFSKDTIYGISFIKVYKHKSEVSQGIPVNVSSNIEKNVK